MTGSHSLLHSFINQSNGTSQSDVFCRMESMKSGPLILLRWENSANGTKDPISVDGHRCFFEIWLD